MKIFKLVLTLSLMASGYLGYTNYQTIEEKALAVKEMAMEREPLSIRRAPTTADEAEARARERIQPPESSDNDSEENGVGDGAEDWIKLILESVLPLVAPIIVAKYKKKDEQGNVRTLDDDIGKLAEDLGVSRQFVRGKLGLGDKRKSQIRTSHKRRLNDKRS
jgi:hypothetical protein